MKSLNGCTENFDYRYTVVGRSFFHPTLGQKGELGDGIEYWRGYYQSLRPTQMGLSLNIGIEIFLVCSLFSCPIALTLLCL